MKKQDLLKIMRREGGITLVALIVTIVILLILATVSVNAVFEQNEIIGKEKQAKEIYANSQATEDIKMSELVNEMASYENENEKDDTTGVTVTVDGNEGLKLTKKNIANYLGKVVTNYVPIAKSITIEGYVCTPSTKYRLYYVDFDGKYGETNGVYLKADSCPDSNAAYGLPETDTTESTASNVKIRELNPSLYKEGVTPPSASYESMRAATFLTNTNNWNILKTGSSLESKVNYVVGAPSVEMMMDSYNTKYNLTESTPNTGTLDENTARAKLFYRYPTKLNIKEPNGGYEVGPCTSDKATSGDGYWYYTSDYSVKTDPTIDSMYFGEDYWLASPSANNLLLLKENNYYGGCISNDCIYNPCMICPLVSLQSSVSLQLQ